MTHGEPTENSPRHMLARLDSIGAMIPIPIDWQQTEIHVGSMLTYLFRPEGLSRKRDVNTGLILDVFPQLGLEQAEAEAERLMTLPDYVGYGTEARTEIRDVFKTKTRAFTTLPRVEQGMTSGGRIRLIQTTLNLATTSFYVMRFEAPKTYGLPDLAAVTPSFDRREFDPIF